MKLKYLSGLISVLVSAGLYSTNASADYVKLPSAAGQQACGVASAASIRCAGAAITSGDKLYIAPQLQSGVYGFPTGLSLINKVDTDFTSASNSKFGGTFSDYVFMDTTTNTVVIGSRLNFGPLNGLPNVSEVNDIFRYGYEGFKVEAGWTRLSSNDLRAYSIAMTEVGLNGGEDVYNPNVVDFRTDVNASEKKPISGLYLIRTDATAFKVINNAIKVRQGGEEGQSVLAVSLAGYAPTKLDAAGVKQGEAVKLYGGTYDSNMSVSGSVGVEYGNAQFNGSVAATNGSQINVASGSTATFNGSFNQQVGSALGGGGTFVFNGGYSPGNSPGAVTVNGNVVFGSANEALFELAGLIQGTQYDHLTVNGNLTFGGVLKLSFINGFTAQAGDTFDLFDWTNATGTFASISTQNANLSSGLAWNFSNLYTNGSISVVATTPVPEPESYALMLLGLGLISLAAGRNKNIKY